MQAVRFLLDYVDRRQVYQALLSAINLGNEEIAVTPAALYTETDADCNELRQRNDVTTVGL